jgi:hypothetical protein
MTTHWITFGHIQVETIEEEKQKESFLFYIFLWSI